MSPRIPEGPSVRPELGFLRGTAMSMLFVAGTVAFVLAGAAYAGGVRLNLSGSIPPGLYRATHQPISRGTVVLACLPATFSQFAKSRGYVPAGSCYDGQAPIGKVVVALAGDTVDVTSHGVSINGTLLRNTAPLPKDSEGRELPSLRVVHRVVPIGEVWLASSYSAKSFDSRYFGGIPRSALVGRVQPLLTADHR